MWQRPMLLSPLLLLLLLLLLCEPCKGRIQRQLLLLLVIC